MPPQPAHYKQAAPGNGVGADYNRQERLLVKPSSSALPPMACNVNRPPAFVSSASIQPSGSELLKLYPVAGRLMR